MTVKQRGNLLCPLAVIVDVKSCRGQGALDGSQRKLQTTALRRIKRWLLGVE